MVDFTTTLAAPQGAGARVVQPAERQATREMDIAPLVTGVLDGLKDYAKASAKKEAEDKKTAILREYTSNEATYAAARSTGDWSASQVMAASQANYNQFITMHPEVIDDLDKARRTVYAGTATGEAEKEASIAQAKKQKEDDMLMESGLPSYPGQSVESRAAQLDAVYTMRRMDKDFQRMTQRTAESRAQSAEGRAQSEYTTAIEKRETTEKTFQAMNQLLAVNFDAHTAFLKDVTSGRFKPGEVQMMADKEIARISAEGYALGGANNQQLVQPVIESFKQLSATAMKMLEPGTDVKRLEDEVNSIILRTKLGFLADPKTRADVVGLQLLGNNPKVSGVAGDAVIGSIARVANMDINTPLYGVPPIVGNPDVEGPVLDLLKGGAGSLVSGKTTGDKNKLKSETDNGIVNVTRQMTDSVSKGLTPDKMSKIAGFYASPEFGAYAVTDALDKATMMAGNKAFQVYYQAVSESVQSSFNSMAANLKGGQETGNLYDLVDIKFQNGALTMVQVGSKWNDMDKTKALQTARQSEKALFDMVKISAHLSGTQDYAKHWEENRHILLPNLYIDPTDLKVGDVRGGKRYLGGMYRSANSWEKVSNGTKR